MVNEKCNVEFQIGTYTFVVVCDITPIDVFHILLGRPWKYDRKFVHGGRKNTYSMERMEKDIHCHHWRMKQFQNVQGQLFC